MKKEMECPNCKKLIGQDDLYCEYCGTKIEKETIKVKDSKKEETTKTIKKAEPNQIALKCPRCGINLKQNDKFCNNCGKRVEQKTKQPKEINTEKAKQVVAKTQNNYFYIPVAIIVTFILCLIVFVLFYNFYLKEMVVETTKKEVTVTDKGIADSVEKVYDAVVVVKNYVNGKLYSTGTGVVYKTDDKYGYVLTNSHVISNGNEVKLVFTNKKELKAEVVGNDEYSDIAVLRIGKENIIKVAEIGSSDALKVGDTAFAVGAPIDSSAYSWTVTRGIISGKNRVVEATVNNSSSRYVMEVLQTDAAINQGNSGGPLCNANGQVIGITNMKLASTTIEGMGFAIPIEKAVEYANKFINGEHISRPYLGIAIYDMSNNFFNPGQNGVYIDTVEKDSPADKGGLKSGDKITKVNGVEVPNASYFKYELYKCKVGDKVKITVERDNKEKEITVKVGSSSKSA